MTEILSGREGLQIQITPDLITWLAPLGVVAAGWGIIYWLNSRLEKKKLRNQLRVQSYRSLWERWSQARSDGNALWGQARFGVVFTIESMLSELQTYQGLGEITRNQKFISDAQIRIGDRWRSLMQELNQGNSKFSGSFFELTQEYDFWRFMIRKLDDRVQELEVKSAKLSQSMGSWLGELLSLNPDLVRDWDKPAIEKGAREMAADVQALVEGTRKLISEIHDELIYPEFGFRWPEDRRNNRSSQGNIVRHS